MHIGNNAQPEVQLQLAPPIINIQPEVQPPIPPPVINDQPAVQPPIPPPRVEANIPLPVLKQRPQRQRRRSVRYQD